MRVKVFDKVGNVLGCVEKEQIESMHKLKVGNKKHLEERSIYIVGYKSEHYTGRHGIENCSTGIGNFSRMAFQTLVYKIRPSKHYPIKLTPVQTMEENGKFYVKYEVKRVDWDQSAIQNIKKQKGLDEC